jgi:hypothetical protein
LLTTAEKALKVNLDLNWFGTFAEIGAGQEVARWFFHVGRAAGTIAKSISAYDMAISDELYGPTDHYVSRSRLQAMLASEFNQLQNRFSIKRGDGRALFVFADTVATHSHSRREGGHGWMGVRFQIQPGEEPSDIIIHIKMLDFEAVNEQEVVGIAGVNLAYGAFYLNHDPKLLITSLMDGLSRRRMEVDMIKFAGPAFATLDNRLMSLELVESALTDAVLFTSEGEVLQPSEVLYEKPILIERGSFRPITNVTLDMIVRAEQQLAQDHPGLWESPVVLMEMTLKNLRAGQTIDHTDFLARVDMLGALGKTVMISSYTRFDRVTSYLRSSTRNWIAMVVGIPTLREIFEDKYYNELDGGLLEGLGRLFQGSVKLLVYPTLASAAEELATAESLDVRAEYRSLYSYFLQNRYIESIRDFDTAQLHVTPGDVLQKLQSSEPNWEAFVPMQVASLIKERGLFGYVHGQEELGIGEMKDSSTTLPAL